MHHIFVDESGELGQNVRSSSHFLITVLCTENLKALEKRLRKEKAILYNAGWPRNLEIKGHTLWSSPYKGTIPKSISDRRDETIKRILASICDGPNRVHYSIVKKEKLDPHLMAAPYGVAYNYLCGNLICNAYNNNNFRGDLEIVVDQRSKETHSKMKFDGYLQTKLVCDCIHKQYLNITHSESAEVIGLQAVDFLSWALFRSFERKDHSFRPLVDKIVGFKEEKHL